MACLTSGITIQQLIEQHIETISLQQWYTHVSSSSMCATYRLFKKQLHFEKYLLMSNNSNRISLTKFKCSDGKMPVPNQVYLYDTDKCILRDLNVVPLLTHLSIFYILKTISMVVLLA